MGGLGHSGRSPSRLMPAVPLRAGGATLKREQQLGGTECAQAAASHELETEDSVLEPDAPDPVAPVLRPRRPRDEEELPRSGVRQQRLAPEQELRGVAEDRAALPLALIGGEGE